jgi:hypothetical protein
MGGQPGKEPACGALDGRADGRAGGTEQSRAGLNFLGVQKHGDFTHENLDVLEYEKFCEYHFEASEC